MTDTPSRLFSLVCILIAVWVLVYWLYEPRSPKVTTDIVQSPASATSVSQASRPGSQPSDSSPAQPDSPVVPPKPVVVERPTPAAPAPSPLAVPQPSPIIEPKFRDYVVQPGDVSWDAIARRIYGDRRMANVISQANPLNTSDKLKPGKTVLKIPLDPTNIQGKPNPEYRPLVVPTSPAASPETTYVVQGDDTLWAISKKVYGKGGLWKTIYEANRGTIKNADRPPAGAVLRIPPAPGQ